MLQPEMSLSLLEELIVQNNWKSLEISCKNCLASSSDSSTSLTIANLLINSAIEISRKKKFRESITLSNLFMSLKFDLSEDVRAELAYKYLSYFSCALRSFGFFHKAKLISQKGLKLCNKYPSLCKSTAYMNLCAILSNMNKHEKALVYAKFAMDSVYEELAELKRKGLEEDLIEKYTVIAIANFNLAVEEEFLGNSMNSEYHYKKCKEILDKHNISSPELYRKVSNSILNCGKHLDSKREVQSGMISKNSFRSVQKSSTPIKGQSRAINITPSKPLRYSTTPTKASITNRSISKRQNNEKPSSARIGMPGSKSLILRNKIFSHKHSNSQNLKVADKPSTKISNRLSRNYVTSNAKRDKISGEIKNEFQVKQEPLINKAVLKIKVDKPNRKTILSCIIKIQAFYRRHLAALKYKLMKNARAKSFQRFKIINNDIFLVRISLENGIKVISLFNLKKKYKSQINLAKSDWELYSIVCLENGSIAFKEPKLHKKLVLHSEIQIDSIPIVINYYVTSSKLLILSTSNHSEISLEIMLPMPLSRLTTRYILDFIQPNIKIANNRIYISKTDAKECSAGYIFLEDSLQKVEAIVYKDTTEFFIDGEKCFSCSTEEDYLSFPSVLLLAKNSQGYYLRNRKRIKELIKEKKLLNNGYEYYIKVFFISDSAYWYYFTAEAEESPTIMGLAIHEKELEAMFSLKGIVKNLRKITKGIIVMNSVLELKSTAAINDKLDVSLNMEKIIIKIQSIYRGNRARDMCKLQRCKNRLLSSQVKIANQKPYIVQFYKLDSEILIEVFESKSLIVFYKFIKDPLEYVTQFYRYSNISLLANAIRLESNPSICSMSGKKYLFVQSEIDLEESRLEKRLYHNISENIVIIAIVYPSKDLLIKAYNYKTDQICCKTIGSASVVDSIGQYKIGILLSLLIIKDNEIFFKTLETHSKQQPEENFKWIYRTCTIIIGVLYQVTVGVKDDKLKFTYKRGSSSGLGVNFIIPISVACEKSGFTENLLIPMANFLIKNMLQMRDDEIIIDAAQGSINLEKIVSKIQATFRSFLLRKKLKKTSQLKMLLKTKIATNDLIYTVLLYEKALCYILYAICQGSLLRKEIEKYSDATPEYILKMQITDLLKPNGTNDRALKSCCLYSKKRERTKLSREDSMLAWKGEGEINGIQCSVYLYHLKHSDMVECHFRGKVGLIETSRNYLPSSELILKRLEINSQYDFELKLSKKGLLYSQERFVSDCNCKVYIYYRKEVCRLIAYLQNERRYLIQEIPKDFDLTRILMRLRIVRKSDEITIAI